MVLQPDTSRQRVKYWLDGETAYSFMRFEALLKLIPDNMEILFKKAMMESSVFLWDVLGENIRRLRYTGDEPPLVEWIRAKKTEHLKEEKPDETHQSMWRRNLVVKDNGDVQLEAP